MRQKKKNIRWNTMRILTVGFFGVILAGAFLLWFPSVIRSRLRLWTRCLRLHQQCV